MIATASPTLEALESLGSSAACEASQGAQIALKLVPVPDRMLTNSSTTSDPTETPSLRSRPINDISGKSRDEVIKSWLPFVENILCKHQFRDGTAREEARADAHLALVRAIDRFEPEKGLSLMTYLYPRIDGAIKDSLREYSKRELGISRAVGKALRIIHVATDALTAVRGCPPTEDQVFEKAIEINNRFNESARVPESLLRLTLRDGKPNKLAFDAPAQTESDDRVSPSLVETFAHEDIPAPEITIGTARALDELLSSIPCGRNQFALRARLGIDVGGSIREQSNLSEIARVLGVSEKRASKIVADYLPEIQAKVRKLDEDGIALITPSIKRSMTEVAASFKLLPEKPRRVFGLVAGLTDELDHAPSVTMKEAAKVLQLSIRETNALYTDAVGALPPEGAKMVALAKARRDAALYLRALDEQMESDIQDEQRRVA